LSVSDRKEVKPRGAPSPRSTRAGAVLTSEELSQELSEAILISKHMMERKYAVLNRLYPALAVMLLLAALLILVMASIPRA